MPSPNDLPVPSDASGDAGTLHRKVLDLIAHHEESTEARTLTADVPPELFDRFEAKCRQNGRSMPEVLQALVAYYADDA
jgi:hypothetical protein